MWAKGDGIGFCPLAIQVTVRGDAILGVGFGITWSGFWMESLVANGKRGRPTKEMELAKKGLVKIPGNGAISKFTPERQETVLNAIKEGLTDSGAAKLAGVYPSTLRKWVEDGAENPEGPYGPWAMAFMQAQGEREQQLTKLLEEHFPKQWMSVARALEVTNKDWKQPGKETTPPPVVNFNLEQTIAKMDDQSANVETSWG